jgi:tetratricopeptide (TPR) repeat protein
MHLLGIVLACSAGFAMEMEHTRQEMARNQAAMDHFIRGATADKMEDYYRAVFEYQEALEADPDSPFLYVALAQDYVLLNKTPQAMGLLAQALDIDPNYKPALELRAGLLVNTINWPEALLLYERLAKIDTTEPEYVLQLLQLYLRVGDFNRADIVYNKLVAIKGESEQLLLQVATVLLMSDSTQRALPYLQRLAEIDPTDAAVIYSLATLYIQAGDTALAQAGFERAAALRPDVARYWMGLAVFQIDKNDYAAACRTLEKAVGIVPDDADLWNFLGTCQNHEGETGAAILSLQEALRLDSTTYSSLGVLALIYDQMDSVEKVIELYERAIELSDSAAVFLNNYAYTLAERAMDLKHAKAMAEKACAADPENASYLDTMGWILFKLENHKSAIRWLRKALKFEPRSSPVLEHLGDVYMDRGSTSKAHKCYRKALKWDPDNEAIRQKLGL